MKTIKYLGAIVVAAVLATVACAVESNTIELTFAPGDTLAYSHDGCERVALDLSNAESPVIFELGRDGLYAFYSNGVMIATQEVSGLGTMVTEPNWAVNFVSFTLDTQEVRTFDVKADMVATNLTYSGTGWGEPGAGTSATIKYRNGEGDDTTLASGLIGTGETAWIPPANGPYTLTHTSGVAVETATITVANLVTITVGDLAAKHLTAKVAWNGTETPVVGQSFALPKGGKDAKLVLTAESGYVLPADQPLEISLNNYLATGESVSIATDIPFAVPYGVQLLGVTNRYPWNGKIDVVVSVLGVDAAKYYQLVTTLTLGGTTKCVSRELGAGKDATYTNTIDCVALFGTNAVGEVSVKLSLEQYAAERAVGVASVTKFVNLKAGEYLIIDLSDGLFVETTLDDYLKSHPNAWTLKDGWADDYKTRYLVMRKVKAGEAYPCDPVASCYPISRTMTPAKDYWIGVYQVTQWQYARVMGYLGGTANPMDNISWNTIRGSADVTTEITKDSAVCFIQQLCKMTNLAGFDLPTEVQWEIAARAGSKEEYGAYVDVDGFAVNGTSGNIGDFAIYSDNRNTYGGPGAVGQLRPNLWGLYDTAGNLLEWCRDGYGEFDRQDVETPAEGDSAGHRVLRGGFCSASAVNCRPSLRFNVDAGTTNGFFGFRLSRICEPDTK